MAQRKKYETQAETQQSGGYDPGRAETQQSGGYTPGQAETQGSANDEVSAARAAMEGYAGSRPDDYISQYGDELAALYDALLNRDPFSYDPSGDALYQQYKSQYTTLGRQAMQDTMGQAAALTGGYGSSYAQSAGDQAYRASLDQLNNMLPELYKLAYSRYNDEGDALRDRYDRLSAREAAEYGRWKDAYDRWQQEYDRASNAYQSAYDRAYQAERDRVKDEQWQKEFDEKIREYNEKNAGRSSSGGGSGKGNTQGGKATPLSTGEHQGAAAAARQSSAALRSYCDRMQKAHNLTNEQKQALYDRYYAYTPEAAREAYGGQPGATGYYV